MTQHLLGSLMYHVLILTLHLLAPSLIQLSHIDQSKLYTHLRPLTVNFVTSVSAIFFYFCPRHFFYSCLCHFFLNFCLRHFFYSCPRHFVIPSVLFCYPCPRHFVTPCPCHFATPVRAICLPLGPVCNILVYFQCHFAPLIALFGTPFCPIL